MRHWTRCHVCGKFMSYEDISKAVVFTPYGNALDLEPPDERFIHRTCWDGLSDKAKALVRKISYLFGFNDG